jgi:DNA polymerase-3 subunit delta'
MTNSSTTLLADNWGLLGHEWAVDMLRQHVAHAATRHAYLFAGPPGLGRRTLALRFAQALNCTQAVKPGVPCGTCRDCKQIEAMQHPDLAIVQAEFEGGTLKVDQVREARRALTLKPYQSKHRVVIFLRFQEANDNAANALLKTLEEAPSYAVLILTADSPEGLLPTVVSRCEVLRLRPLPVETVESFLKEHGADADKAHLIAHISSGRPGYALRLSREPSALAFREEKLADLRSLLPASRVDKFAYAEKLAKDRDTMRSVLLLWLSFWRDVLLRAGGASTPLTNIDQAQGIESLAGRINLPRARRVVSDLEKALSQLEASVNPRLLAEVLLLDWPKV